MPKMKYGEGIVLQLSLIAAKLMVSRLLILGAGHASSGETLCGRIIAALKSQALLNESVGAGYIERNWPPALKECGAWPLASLRQSFLNGSLTRLLDPDSILRNKIVEFVGKGDLGLASGQKPDGTYDRVWFEEQISSDEVTFESGVFLLTKAKAKALKAGMKAEPGVVVAPGPQPVTEEVKEPEKEKEPASRHSNKNTSIGWNCTTGDLEPIRNKDYPQTQIRFRSQDWS